MRKRDSIHLHSFLRTPKRKTKHSLSLSRMQMRSTPVQLSKIWNHCRKQWMKIHSTCSALRQPTALRKTRSTTGLSACMRINRRIIGARLISSCTFLMTARTCMQGTPIVAMFQPKARARLVKTLRDALSASSARMHILPMSDFIIH